MLCAMKQFLFLTGILVSLVLSSCVETRQVYHLNSDGSGRVSIQATFQQAKLKVKGKEQNEDSGPDREDTIKMLKKARQIIERAKGVDAWDSVNYGLNEEGRVTFSGVAYFPDISEFALNQIPFTPVKSFNEERLVWGVTPEPVDTTKPRSYRDSPLPRKAVQERVNTIQKGYKRASKMLNIASSAFDLTAVYHLPYKVKNTTEVTETGKRTVKASLDRDRLKAKMSQLMGDEDKLTKLVAQKGVNNFDWDNKYLLQAAFADEPFKRVQFRTGLFSGGPEEAFSYKETIKAIQPQKPDISVPQQ